MQNETKTAGNEGGIAEVARSQVPTGNVPNPNSSTKQLSPVALISQGLDQLRPQLQASLPKHITADHFKRVTLTAVNLAPSLVKADRRSLFNACMKCAADGLLPDGREAALVPFGNQVTYMPMVFGIIKKLRQSGEIASVSARVVYQAEIDTGRFEFKIQDGQEILRHEPILVGERGAPVIVYATARFKDGTVQNEPMTVADVEKVRKSSRSGANGPWKDWWDEMARKTAVRRLSKYLPLSAEDRRIMEEHHEDTEFDALKNAAVDAAQQAQSIDAAALLLGGPIDDETGTEA